MYGRIFARKAECLTTFWGKICNIHIHLVSRTKDRKALQPSKLFIELKESMQKELGELSKLRGQENCLFQGVSQPGAVNDCTADEPVRKFVSKFVGTNRPQAF